MGEEHPRTAQASAVRRVRVMPCLLLRGTGLVKTIRFREPRYIGDPRNTVKLFNDKDADELVLLDIEATVAGRPPNFALVAEVAGECFMPMAYGGGIRSQEDAKRIVAAGVEKVVVNTAAARDVQLVERLARDLGSQAVVVSIDAKREANDWVVMVRGARERTGLSPREHARIVERAGAGEILLNCIDRDGTMAGYDTELIRSVTGAVGIPVVACGGAGRLEDLRRAVDEGGAHAVAAGSIFVYYGKQRAVLVTFPPDRALAALFGERSG